MKKGVSIVLLSLTIFALFASCATTFKAGDGKLSYGEIKGDTKGNIDVKSSYVYLLSPYLISFSKPYEKIDKMIAPELISRGATAATNMEIKEGFTFIDMLLTGLTGGIIGFRYVNVSAVAIKQ